MKSICGKMRYNMDELWHCSVVLILTMNNWTAALFVISTRDWSYIIVENHHGRILVSSKDFPQFDNGNFFCEFVFFRINSIKSVIFRYANSKSTKFAKMPIDMLYHGDGYKCSRHIVASPQKKTTWKSVLVYQIVSDFANQKNHTICGICIKAFFKLH